MRRWFAIGFDSHDVYTTPEGFVRNKTYRGPHRDPILKHYPSATGSLGARFRQLKGHIALAYNLITKVGDETELHRRLISVLLAHLRAHCTNGNSKYFPTNTRPVVGEGRASWGERELSGATSGMPSRKASKKKKMHFV
jgi:hypothetical protein